MADSNRVDVLARMYEEHATQARQHETQRERMTAAMLVIAAALIGVIAKEPSGTLAIVASPGLIIIGLYGWLFSLKHYERNRFHASIMREFQSELTDELSSKASKRSIREIRSRGRKRHYKEYPRHSSEEHKNARYIAQLSLYYFWAGLPVLVAVLGVVLTIVLFGGSICDHLAYDLFP